MQMMRNLACAALIVAASALACAAQTFTMKTATYNFKSNQTTAGAVAGSPDTYYVSFSGQGQTQNNKISVNIDVVTFTLIYVSNGAGSGTVVGGQWSATTVNKDRAPTTVGGAVGVGAQIPLRADNTVGPGNVAVTFEVSDPAWPVSGTLVGSIDNSRPPRAAGLLTFTYPVVFR